jgi:hypothetical protein
MIKYTFGSNEREKLEIDVIAEFASSIQIRTKGAKDKMAGSPGENGGG